MYILDENKSKSVVHSRGNSTLLSYQRLPKTNFREVQIEFLVSLWMILIIHVIVHDSTANLQKAFKSKKTNWQKASCTLDSESKVQLYNIFILENVMIFLMISMK